jgi:hypothetical protein
MFQPKRRYVKALKDAAGYITTAWQNQMLQNVWPGQNSGEKPPTPSPRKQEDEEWKVVTSKKMRRKATKKRMATDVREMAKKGGRTAAPTPPARRQPTQQPQKRTTGLPKLSSGAAAMKTGPSPASGMATLPRIQRTSAVTHTLSENKDVIR